MSLAVAIPLLILVAILGAILWPALRQDAVGRPRRLRRRDTGLHGQVMEWLYWDARVRRPDLARYAKDAVADDPEDPADRALHAIVLREALEHNLGMAEAYQRVKQRARDPKTRAFLNGQMSRAVRIHWQGRFKGPDALFLPWFYAVATVRYGRRHLFLDTLSDILKELSTP